MPPTNIHVTGVEVTYSEGARASLIRIDGILHSGANIRMPQQGETITLSVGAIQEPEPVDLDTDSRARMIDLITMAMTEAELRQITVNQYVRAGCDIMAAEARSRGLPPRTLRERAMRQLAEETTAGLQMVLRDYEMFRPSVFAVDSGTSARTQLDGYPHAYVEDLTRVEEVPVAARQPLDTDEEFWQAAMDALGPGNVETMPRPPAPAMPVPVDTRAPRNIRIRKPVDEEAELPQSLPANDGAGSIGVRPVFGRTACTHSTSTGTDTNTFVFGDDYYDDF